MPWKSYRSTKKYDKGKHYPMYDLRRNKPVQLWFYTWRVLTWSIYSWSLRMMWLLRTIITIFYYFILLSIMKILSNLIKDTEMNSNQILLLRCWENLLSVCDTPDNWWETALYYNGVWDIYEWNYVGLFQDCKTWNQVLSKFYSIEWKKSEWSEVE